MSPLKSRAVQVAPTSREDSADESELAFQRLKVRIHERLVDSLDLSMLAHVGALFDSENVRFWGGASTSVAGTVICVVVVFSTLRLVLNEPMTGGSFTAVMLSDTSAGVLSVVPSLTLKVKLSGP